ncbi:SMP-30/gluconolactonase/LRE family protein [Ralstonia chuxiongensis]|uniref:SMP-30/gluconolactonase/LRE family protein n=1 Tax=Ralstonia chuxiongensis TaxID=2957504 RepID=A0AA41WN07_9RALS|nr:SMP-30/gluconolactonase/LRE family protein [Ralstonia chuxiongensis]MCP1171246.1 SMP-30/gluconolactonase/LRE family protein [Ralstonia chuxiongensis]
MTAPIIPECVWRVGATLGEGAVWHAASRCLVFVDIKGRRLYRYDPDTAVRRSWIAPGQIGFALPSVDGNWICGVQGGLYRFAFATGSFSRVLPVETDQPGNRLNDGFVDRTGALWFGSMDDGESEPSGQLYRVGLDGRLSVRDSGYVITNGPTTSPDGRTLYHTDTLQRVVYAFDLGDDGSLQRKRVFTSIEGTGHPDGMAVDEEGCVWVALFGGGRIERFSPDGRCIGRVDFPCSNITKLAFGGDDLQTVYATTARKGLSDEALQKESLAGGLFAFRAPVKGRPSTDSAVNFSAAMTDQS